MVKLSIGLLKAKRPTVGLKSEELKKNYKIKIDALKKVSKRCSIIFLNLSFERPTVGLLAFKRPMLNLTIQI